MYKSYPKKDQIKLGDKVKKVVKKKRSVPLELKPLKELIKIADDLAAIEVKKRADRGGYCVCFTCNKSVTWSVDKGNTNTQNGHWISRACKLLRWDFDNMRVQCYHCNMRREGMKNEYEFRLRAEIGDERVDEMKIIGRNESDVGREFVLNIINTLKGGS